MTRALLWSPVLLLAACTSGAAGARSPSIRPLSPLVGPLTEDERVLAPYGTGAYYFVGVVRAVRPDGQAEVLFLDGDQGVVPAEALREENVGPGTLVHAHVDGREGWHPGQVVERDGDRVRVALDTGGSAWVPITQVRLPAPPQTVRPSEEPPSGAAPEGTAPEGTRVLAPYGDGEYYFVGVVRAVRPDGQAEVLFLDGDEGIVPAQAIREDSVRPGAAVHVHVDDRWVSGQVAEREGDRVRISVDGGGDEWVPLSLVRVPVQP